MANIKTFKHPNYDEKLDFQAIALQDADFAAILSSNRGVFNFHKPEHVLQLTKSLLKRDFGLKLKLPDDRLCPPVSAPALFLMPRTDEGIDSHTVCNIPSFNAQDQYETLSFMCRASTKSPLRLFLIRS